MYRFKSILQTAIVFALCGLLCLTAFAGTHNPMTGDTSGRYLWVVIAIAAVALLVLIITALAGKKGGKK